MSLNKSFKIITDMLLKAFSNTNNSGSNVSIGEFPWEATKINPLVHKNLSHQLYKSRFVIYLNTGCIKYLYSCIRFYYANGFGHSTKYIEKSRLKSLKLFIAFDLSWNYEIYSQKFWMKELLFVVKGRTTQENA